MTSREEKTNITVEEPSDEEETIQHICVDNCMAEQEAGKPCVPASSTRRQGNSGHSYSLSPAENWNFGVENSIMGSRLFERMNQLFDRNSQPDIKVTSSSSKKRIDRAGNVVEQAMTIETRYKEASQVIGYKWSDISKEEEVFYHRQIERRGREARQVRGKNNVYKMYDNYLNCTPEDSETFESDWQSYRMNSEAYYSIPVHFLDEDEPK